MFLIHWHPTNLPRINILFHCLYCSEDLNPIKSSNWFLSNLLWCHLELQFSSATHMGDDIFPSLSVWLLAVFSSTWVAPPRWSSLQWGSITSLAYGSLPTFTCRVTFDFAQIEEDSNKWCINVWILLIAVVTKVLSPEEHILFTFNIEGKS